MTILADHTAGDLRRSIEQAASTEMGAWGPVISMSQREVVSAEPIVIAASSETPWKSDVIEQLGRLAKLARNWDSYGARPLAAAPVRALIRLTDQLADSIRSAPRLAMSVDGGIVCDWSGTDAALTLFFDGGGNVSVDYTDNVSGDEWEGQIQEAADLDKKIWHASI